MRKRLLKKVKLLIVVIVLLLINIPAVIYLSNSREVLSTTQADALYGGYADAVSYPFAGYILNYSAFLSPQTCGLVYLENNLAISAAHCFDETQTYYTGNFTLEKNANSNYAIREYSLHPQWDPTTLKNDIALIRLDDKVINVKEFATVGRPAIGCDYEVLAYGTTDQRVLSKDDLRRKSSVCIDNITNDRIYISSEDGGICFGDSGSPIFIKDTNKVVGLVSAITANNAEYSEENCFVNNSAVATRLDSFVGFINSQEVKTNISDIVCGNNGDICSDTELCRSNKCIEPSDIILVNAVDYTTVGSLLANWMNLVMIIAGNVLIIAIVIVIYRNLKSVNSGYYN